MYEEDYVKRMVQQLAAAVIRLLQLVKAGDTGAARREMEHVLNDLFGVSPSMILTLGEEVVFDLVFRGEPPDPERVAILADVLRIHGDVAAAEGGLDQALPWYEASLRYLIAGTEKLGFIPGPQALDASEVLVRKLLPDGLAPEMVASLYALYRGQGRHALASELIVGFADRLGAGAEGIEEAEAYLGVLSGMREDELSEYGLTRERVSQLLARIASRPASDPTGLRETRQGTGGTF
jgi:hypothetical protein